ncbi:MAG TPA: hypothetical protein VHZ98_16565 [Galbitalea sp.]|nr:hypothetical protein [Galbitalea sp.]
MTYNRIAMGACALAAAGLLAVSLSGCSGSGTSPKAAVDRAKQTTLTIESQIAAFVPADKVVSTHQTLTSKVIFPCLGKSGQSYWPGSTIVDLKSGVDTGAVMSAIAANWTNDSGWTVFQSKDASGNPTLIIKSSINASYTVSFVQGPQLSIVALSSCFPSAGLEGLTSY